MSYSIWYVICVILNYIQFNKIPRGVMVSLVPLRVPMPTSHWSLVQFHFTSHVDYNSDKSRLVLMFIRRRAAISVLHMVGLRV